MATAFAAEWRTVLKDTGVLIFFLALPIAYPIVYTLVYNPEVLRQMPVAVVDHSRTAESRDFVRKVASTPAVQIYDYYPDLQEAKRMVDENKVYGILEIEPDYAKEIGSGRTGHVTFYCDMALMLRFRTFAFDLTNVQIAEISEITAGRLNMVGAESLLTGMPVQSESYMLGDTTQGFASFVMPGIVVLILQQSLVLGAVMILGTERERRRRRGFVGTNQSMTLRYATVWGKALCYTLFYIVPTLFALHFIPVIFNLPHIGNPVQYLLFALPFILASSFFGMTIGTFARDRESAFMIVVVTSVIFLFLSGLTWPRFAMPEFWLIIGDFVPATWAVEGFIQINSTGATLADVATNYYWLWGLAAAYSILATLPIRKTRRTKTSVDTTKV